MSVLVEFAMFPTDKGTSVSEYVSRIVKMINDENVHYQLTPMGTVFETEDMKQALEIINKSYLCLHDDCERVYSTVKFDIQKEKSNRIVGKVKSVENKTGLKLSK